MRALKLPKAKQSRRPVRGFAATSKNRRHHADRAVPARFIDARNQKHRTAEKPLTQNPFIICSIFESCFKRRTYSIAPCGTRTHDPRIRNPLLYPAELRALCRSYNASGRYYVRACRQGKEAWKSLGRTFILNVIDETPLTTQKISLS